MVRYVSEHSIWSKILVYNPLWLSQHSVVVEGQWFTQGNLSSMSRTQKADKVVHFVKKANIVFVPIRLCSHFMLNNIFFKSQCNCVHSFVFVPGLHLYAQHLSGGAPVRTSLGGAQGHTTMRIKGQNRVCASFSSRWRMNMSSPLHSFK